MLVDFAEAFRKAGVGMDQQNRAFDLLAIALYFTLWHFFPQWWWVWLVMLMPVTKKQCAFPGNEN